MKRNSLNFDIVVVGAGSSGSAAAGFFAEKGFKVALLDCLKFSRAGSRWVNDVPPWMFDSAGLKRPVAPEKVSGFVPAVMLDRNDRIRIRIKKRPMWGVDMRRLVKRLQKGALDKGATPFENIEIEQLVCQDGRPVSITIKEAGLNNSGSKKDAGKVSLEASLFVDASGVENALLRRVPALMQYCPPLEENVFCSAAQQMCKIKDRAGALSFLEKMGVAPGTFMIWTAVVGGYSTLMIQVEEDLETVSLLTGVMQGLNRPSGLDLLRQAKKNSPWIGRVRYGGARTIPVRRPYARLGSPGIALVGDAACQVFPAHGSGVGGGLIAARELADAAENFDDPGSSKAVWDYQVRFHKKLGGVSAAYEIFARMGQSLHENDIDEMLVAGLLTENGIVTAMNQKMPTLDLKESLQIARGIIRTPRLAFEMGKMVPAMFATHALYRRTPVLDNRFLFKVWSGAVDLISGNGRRNI
jgi:menaquinone-9 beta-reductase